MATTLETLREYQWGLESTRGTAVAATSKILCEGIEFGDEPQQIMRPPLLAGVLYPTSGFNFPTQRGQTFRAFGPLNYEQIQNWLNMTVGVDAAPTGSGPYVWTHTRNPAADPVLSTLTLERRLTDGSTPIDHEFAYATGQQITLRGSPSGEVRYEVRGITRHRQDSTFTAAQTLPTPEHAPHALTRVYMDTTWGGLGGTQVSAQVLDWEWDFRTGMEPLYTADNRTDLDFVTTGLNGRSVGITARLQFLAGAQYATELAAAEAQTLRAVQIQLTGTSNRDITISFLARIEQGSLNVIGAFQGQDVIELALVGDTDRTNLCEVVVTNNVATLV